MAMGYHGVWAQTNICTQFANLLMADEPSRKRRAESPSDEAELDKKVAEALACPCVVRCLLWSPAAQR
jgi:hypothetical protein